MLTLPIGRITLVYNITQLKAHKQQNTNNIDNYTKKGHPNIDEKKAHC
jgi:hypothetical protein